MAELSRLLRVFLMLGIFGFLLSLAFKLGLIAFAGLVVAAFLALVLLMWIVAAIQRRISRTRSPESQGCTEIDQVKSLKPAQAGERRSASTAAPCAPTDREFEEAILLVLLESGGQGRAKSVTDAVGRRLRDGFSAHDLEKLKSGDPRWRTRLQFVRYGMKEEGLFEPDSERGPWVLTSRGQDAAKALRR